MGDRSWRRSVFGAVIATSLGGEVSIAKSEAVIQNAWHLEGLPIVVRQSRREDLA